MRAPKTPTYGTALTHELTTQEEEEAEEVVRRQYYNDYLNKDT